MKAHLLELRLYQDNVALSFVAMKDVLTANFKYMLYMLKPMLVLAVPMLLIVIHLAARFEYRPLAIDERAIVSLKLWDEIDPGEVTLDVPVGIEIETPPLRIPPKNQIDWRVRAAEEGKWEIKFYLNNELVTKKLVVGSEIMCLAPSRFAKQLLGQLLNPAEESLPSASFAQEIHVQYPSQEVSVLGWNIHWLVIFFAFSMTAAFAMKGILGVEI